jgi:hypothetical protein
MNQHADVGLGLIDYCFHRPLLLTLRATPEIPRDGGQVRIPEERFEGFE